MMGGISSAQTSTLAVRVPMDKYDASTFEQNVTYSAPNSSPITTTSKQQDGDFMVFAAAPPGTVLTLDNTAHLFDGSDIIVFESEMRRAKKAVRVGEAKVYVVKS